MQDVEVARFLAELGGVSTRARLVKATSRAQVDAALAIADSALRHGVLPAVLRRVARSVTGQPGAARARRVVELATPDAANPFESVLRAICVDVPGLVVRPQLLILTPRSSARAWSPWCGPFTDRRSALAPAVAPPERGAEAPARTHSVRPGTTGSAARG